jgi:signal transduction histidine kinase
MPIIHGNFSASELLRHISASVHQGIAVMDADLNFVLVNKTAAAMLDLPEEFLERSFSLEELIRLSVVRDGVEDVEAEVSTRIKVAMERAPHDFERVRPDGKVIRIQGTPLEGGGFVTMFTDVTEPYRQKASILEENDRLELRLKERSLEIEQNRGMLLAAVDAVRDGLAIADDKGRLLLANSSFRKILSGVEDRLVAGADVIEVLRQAEGDDLCEAVAEFRGDGATEHKFSGGTWYRVSCRPTGDNGLIFKLTDITAFKKQHSKLRRHTDELVRMLRQEIQLNEMQREFVSMASHEFRTPLAIIDSNAQRILRRIEDIDTQALATRVGNIRESVDRMQYLINRFLNASQSETGDLELELAPKPLRDVVESVCRRQSRIAATHAIDIDLGGLGEEAMIDQNMFEQCLINVLSNAVKYSPGAEKVQVTGSRKGRYNVIRVRDYGVGIPADEIPKICNRYFRASTSSGIAGTGIGLNMAQMVMKKHRGRLVVTSKVGEGTSVDILLPVFESDVRDGAGQNEVKQERAAHGA